MVFVNDKKYACETCIKGHRSSACNHSDRPLFEIKKKGRPTTQCDHCRELRRTKQVHIKCVCESKEEAVGPQISFSIPTKKSNRVGVDFQAAFPHGLAGSSTDAAINITSEAVVSPAATSDSASAGAHASRASANSSANANVRVPCTCGSGAGGTCTCWSPRQSSSSSSAKSSRRSTTSRRASPPSALTMTSTLTTTTARIATTTAPSGRAGGQESGYYPQRGNSPMTSFPSHPHSGSRSPALPLDSSHHDPSVGIPHGHTVRGAPAFSPYAAAHERHHVSPPLPLGLEHDFAFDDTSVTSPEELEAFLQSLASAGSNATIPPGAGAGAMMAVSPDATSSPGSLSPGNSTPWSDSTFTQPVPLVSSMSMCDCGGNCNCQGCFINLASAAGSSMSRCNPSAPCSSCFQCQLTADTEEFLRSQNLSPSQNRSQNQNQNQNQTAFSGVSASTTMYNDGSQEFLDLDSWLRDVQGGVQAQQDQDQDALLASMINWDDFSSTMPMQGQGQGQRQGQGQVAPQLMFTPSPPSSGPNTNNNDWVSNTYFERQEPHPHLRVPPPQLQSLSQSLSQGSSPASSRMSGNIGGGGSGGPNSTASLSRSSSSGSRMSSASGSSGSSGANMHPQQQQQMRRPMLGLPTLNVQQQHVQMYQPQQTQSHSQQHPHPSTHPLPLPRSQTTMARGRPQVNPHNPHAHNPPLPPQHQPRDGNGRTDMSGTMGMNTNMNMSGSNNTNSGPGPSRTIRPKGNSPLLMPFGYHQATSSSSSSSVSPPASASSSRSPPGR